jgi:hypothetical protein
MQFSANGLIVVMVVLGGLGSIWGPALGAVVIVLFQQELSIYLSRWQTLMGLTLIAVVMFGPRGIWGLLRSAGRRWDELIVRLRESQAGPGRQGPALRAGQRAGPEPAADRGAAAPGSAHGGVTDAPPEGPVASRGTGSDAREARKP